jgi:hypothetical protein
MKNLGYDTEHSVNWIDSENIDQIIPKAKKVEYNASLEN